MELTRRTAIGSALSAAAAAAQQGAKRPNILFICSDQHAGAYVGANGHPIVRTPNLDRLAARGANFRQAYCGSPVCAPGRAAMMTGQFASDVGSFCNSTPFDGRALTWGNRLTKAGYRCWATGKMDLWQGKDFGFREEKTSHGHSTDPDITSLFRMPVCFRAGERANANGSFADRVAPDKDKADRALRFLREESKRGAAPWCMYVGFTKPHPKFHAHAKYQEMYPPEKMPLPQWPANYLESRHAAFQMLANFKNIQNPVPRERVQRARAAYFGLITELDGLIGEVMDELDRSGQAENTLVIYTSDHGEMLGEHGLWLKNVLLDGAARVPLIMAGPGVGKGKTVETPVSHADMVATMLEAGGAERTRELRGHSLLNGSHPGYAYAESHSEGNATGSFLIRKEHWKYLYFTGDEPLLFDLKNDPGEFRNLAKDKQHEGVRKELHGLLTSLVNPDAVTAAGFARQREVRDRLVREQSREEFYGELVGRLGPIQARLLTEECYRGKAI
ncbi:MAG: sulfatase-like hydrolase/transferase [Acidobacteria bacterium]|nr:sulfatase-like hydrolase/transferase [Acidobacteriota bacterium]